jgi:hypothetical protein
MYLRPRRVPMRPTALATTALCVAGAVLAGSLTSSQPRRVAAPRHEDEARALRSQLSVRTLAPAANRDYRVGVAGAGFVARNPAQGLRLRFTAAGVQIGSGRTRVGLSLRGVGYGASLAAVAAEAPIASANAVIYRRPGLSEWYRNTPRGLEQGFTIARAPAGRRSGSLTISLALAGARAELTSARHTLSLLARGGVALRYGGLVATDAHGHVLPASVALRRGGLLLRVDDRGAAYPLVIDPFIQQAGKLLGSEASSYIHREAVSLSGDGNTALIGEPTGKFVGGVAWVFTRSGSTWSQQGGKLTGAGEVGEGEFGSSAVLSADGNTALLGAPLDNGKSGAGVGAAWVFTRSGSTWSPQGAKLTGAGEVGSADFGASAALSGDGNTALIGSPGASGETGNGAAAYVFTRSGSIWTQQTRLTGAGAFGTSVALSADGNTAVIGSSGEAYVFTRAGGKWTQLQELSGTEGFGASVALSADGKTALIGAPRLHSEGGVFVFAVSGESFKQQGGALTSGSEYSNEFGSDLALSANASTAIIGAFGNYQPGALTGHGAWVFTRSGETWTQRGEGITEAEREGQFSWYFGDSEAVSSEGTTAIIAGWGGAAYVYVDVPSAPKVTTQSARELTRSSAVANAIVNPEGELVSECKFEYGLSTSYESSVPCSAAPGSGERKVAVSASVAGLSKRTTYHFRISAKNGTGTGHGLDETFLTLPYAPAAFTTSATSITKTSATLNAIVNPQGANVTVCKFEYGNRRKGKHALEKSAPCSPMPGEGDSPVTVSASVARLTGHTFFRISATNEVGTSLGLINRFTAH